MKCPKCFSDEILGDVVGVDLKAVPDAEVLLEHHFCRDCGYSWAELGDVEEALDYLRNSSRKGSETE